MQNNTEEKISFMSLPLSMKMYAVAFLAMVVAVCMIQSHAWDTRVDYSFGYLTPMFVLYVIYDRFPKIVSVLSTRSTGSSKGLIPIFADLFFGSMFFCGFALFTLFCFVFSQTLNWGAPTFVITFGFVFASFAMVYFASSTNAFGEPMSMRSRIKFLSLFVFPCFIWLVSAPLLSTLETRVSLFLLSKVAVVVVSIMDSLGFIVELKGNTISFPTGTVGVADACSGIRSLTACLFAGSFLAAAMLDKLWKKITLVGVSMFFAFLFNLIRALFLSFWAYENGSDSISGFVHDAAGYFVLGMTVIGLLVFVSLFNINPIPEEFRKNKPESNSENDEDKEVQ